MHQSIGRVSLSAARSDDLESPVKIIEEDSKTVQEMNSLFVLPQLKI